MGVGELVERLGASYRDVRYVLEQGILPSGVPDSPGRGEHRELTQGQAYWLAVVVTLKGAGIRVPIAGAIARYAEYAVSGVSRRLSWDPDFNPFRGRMNTEFRYFLDIAELEYCRIVTDASPSGGGRLEEYPWVHVDTNREAKGVAPLVIVRIDLGRLAKLIAA